MMLPGKGRKAAEAAGNGRALVNSVPVPMIVVDRGVVAAANRWAADLFGGELDGRRLEQLLTAADRARLEATARGARPARHELRLRRLDGTPFTAIVSASPAADGQALVFQETGSQRLREEEARQAQVEAAQDMRARMRFFAGASHDLRQPLQAMALFVSVLEGMTADKPQARNVMQSLKLALSTMEEMFESLLGLARLDAGMLRASPGVFMIGDVLEKLEEESQAQAEQAGVRLRVMPAAEAVHSDAAMLARILRSFVSNAIRYNDKGGKVLVGCRKRGRHLRIEVWDNGSGIAEERFTELLEEFQQDKIGEKQKGSGLGLAIAQRLARLLDLRLDARSRWGQGSVFALEVPLADVPEPAAEAR